MAGGFQSLLQNGLGSFSAPPSDPITQHSTSSKKGKNVINIDDGDGEGDMK